MAKILSFLCISLWKFYAFQKVFFTNPFFNYKLFFKKLEQEKYRRSKKYICLQVFGQRLLEETLSTCHELNMKPFLIFGTLLGHRRDNGFIPHDSDIDIGLLRDDFAKINELKKEMKKRGYIVRGQSNFGISFRKPRFRGLNVDFYLFFEENDKMACVAGIKNKFGKCCYPSEIFSKFKKEKFMGTIEILVPSQTERYLTITYGNWQSPDISYNMLYDCNNLEITNQQRLKH